MTGTFRLHIEIGNESMQSRHDIFVALKNVAIKIIGGKNEGKIMDENGNTVGEFELKEE